MYVRDRLSIRVVICAPYPSHVIQNTDSEYSNFNAKYISAKNSAQLKIPNKVRTYVHISQSSQIHDYKRRMLRTLRTDLSGAGRSLSPKKIRQVRRLATSPPTHVVQIPKIGFISFPPDGPTSVNLPRTLSQFARRWNDEVVRFLGAFWTAYVHMYRSQNMGGGVADYLGDPRSPPADRLSVSKKNFYARLLAPSRIMPLPKGV